MALFRLVNTMFFSSFFFNLMFIGIVGYMPN
jgi:hypothetical protein